MNVCSVCYGIGCTVCDYTGEVTNMALDKYYDGVRKKVLEHRNREEKNG
mgnify:CR=1 FL=1